MLSEHAMRRQICALGVSEGTSWASGAVFYCLDFHVMSWQALLIMIVLGHVCSLLGPPPCL